jgi:uroporphyrinogen III methyltransferase/synthase
VNALPETPAHQGFGAQGAAGDPKPQMFNQGIVFLVGAGPGDPRLLTLRGAELISTADVILHDELVHPALLELAKPDADVRSVGKRGADRSSKQAKQEAIDEELVTLARAGKRVVRLKGGDPFLFGRGSEEAEALAKANLPFEVVPGVCSPLGATAYAGFSLTHRDHASSVVFVSATTRAGKLYDFAELASVQGTLCVLMGMHNIDAVVQALVGPGKRPPETPTAVIQWGTWARQRVVTSQLDQIVERIQSEHIASPAILIVGAAAVRRDSLRWFDKRPLFGKRVLVLRPRHQADEVVNMIRQRGGEPLLWPAIEIAAPPDPAPMQALVQTLDDYQIIVFTSENSVERLFDAIRSEQLDARAFGRSKVAAVGTSTMQALAHHGLRADIVPGEFHGESLADAILESPLVKQRLSSNLPVRVAFPRARVAREVLPEKLRAAGCDVTLVVAYETKKAGPEKRAALVRMLEQRDVDVILLSASSTADAVADALGDRLTDLLSGVLVASIGEITTTNARKRGIDVAVTASTSTMEGLVDAIEQSLKAL